MSGYFSLARSSPEVVDFRDFITDASDHTAAFATAATQVEGKTLFIPEGTYYVKPKMVTAHAYFAGTTVRGAGRGKTVIQVLAEEIDPAAAESYRILGFKSGTKFEDLTIDGGEDLLTYDPATDRFTFTLFHAGEDGGEHIAFERIHARNVPGVAAREGSFAILRAARHVTYRDILLTQTRFTGPGADGIPTGDLSVDANWAQHILLENIVNLGHTDNPLWMGLALYGARDVTIRGYRARNIGANGLNIEWAERVRAHDVDIEGSRGSGICFWGWCDDVEIHRPRLVGNATGASTDAGEVRIANSTHVSGDRGTPHRVSVIDPVLRPGSGKNDLRVSISASGVTYGTPMPQRLLFQVPSFKPLTVSIANGVATQWPAGIVHAPATFPHAVEVMPLADSLTFFASISSEPTTSDGSEGQPELLTATSQYTYGSVDLVNGRRYAFRCRFKHPDASEWWFIAMGATELFSWRSKGSEHDDWVEAGGVFDVPAEGTYDFRIQARSTGTTQLVVDWLTLTYL